MKVGSVVRCKQTGRIGFIFGKSIYKNWGRVYWIESGEKNQRVNHSLEVLYEGQ